MVSTTYYLLSREGTYFLVWNGKERGDMPVVDFLCAHSAWGGGGGGLEIKIQEMRFFILNLYGFDRLITNRFRTKESNVIKSESDQEPTAR